MTDPTPTNKDSGSVEDELNKVVHILSQLMWTSHPDLAVEDIKAAISAYTQRLVLQANIELIEELLDAQDQEVDLDGRPATKPYYIFNGDGERFKLESILEQLQKQLSGLEEVK